MLMLDRSGLTIIFALSLEYPGSVLSRGIDDECVHTAVNLRHAGGGALCRVQVCPLWRNLGQSSIRHLRLQRLRTQVRLVVWIPAGRQRRLRSTLEQTLTTRRWRRMFRNRSIH